MEIANLENLFDLVEYRHIMRAEIVMRTMKQILP